MVFCSKCGKEYDSRSILCNSCGSVLMNEKYLELNKLENFNEIVNDNNVKILEENPLSEDEYNTILKNITEIASDYLKDFRFEFENEDILDKIKLLIHAYANFSYKSKGSELGSYSYNHIKVDDRLNDSDVISTLIHELSHHLFSEIFEQMLMYIWEVEKTDALEAYVSFTLGTNPIFVLMNEYCAHTVEGRFIPHGYQNYGSFNNVLIEEFDLKKDSEVISFALIMGNSIADDLIKVLENFITSDLRNEIKQEFKKDYNSPPNYDEILLEQKEIMASDEKLKHMHVMLMTGMSVANMENSDEIFSQIKDEFTLNNS